MPWWSQVLSAERVWSATVIYTNRLLLWLSTEQIEWTRDWDWGFGFKRGRTKRNFPLAEENLLPTKLVSESVVIVNQSSCYLSSWNGLKLLLFLGFNLCHFLKQKTKSFPYFMVNKLKSFTFFLKKPASLIRPQLFAEDKYTLATSVFLFQVRVECSLLVTKL